MIFHENRLLADGSHEISYLILLKIWKDVATSVVIGAFNVAIKIAEDNEF